MFGFNTVYHGEGLLTDLVSANSERITVEITKLHIYILLNILVCHYVQHGCQVGKIKSNAGQKKYPSKRLDKFLRVWFFNIWQPQARTLVEAQYQCKIMEMSNENKPESQFHRRLCFIEKSRNHDWYIFACPQASLTSTRWYRSRPARAPRWRWRCVWMCTGSSACPAPPWWRLWSLRRERNPWRWTRQLKRKR